MKRLVILGILFFGLAVFALGYLKNRPSEAGSLVGADRDFGVPQIEKVHKIFLANRLDTNTVLLEKRQGKWWYNGKYPARENAMENLLQTIQKVQMMYKPPNAAVPFMLEDLATRGIKVELYDKRDGLIKAYYVGGSTPDERGTYMIMENAEQPYVTHLPSWEGNIRFRYNLKGDDWRDRSVFAVDQDEIDTLSVEYPKQRESSFVIVRDANKYRVLPFYPLQQKREGVPQKGRIEAYLNHFESLGAENFRNTYSTRDSIRQLTPFSIIRLKTKSGNVRRVSLFPIYPEQALPGYEQAALERYFIDVNGEDFMLGQQRVLGAILRAYPYFYE